MSNFVSFRTLLHFSVSLICVRRVLKLASLWRISSQWNSLTLLKKKNKKKKYNDDLIRRNTHWSPVTPKTNGSVTTKVTLPGIKGLYETIWPVLQPFHTRVAYKSITTQCQSLTNVKDKDEPKNRQGAIYGINNSDCHASYIRETDRNLSTRLTEHKRMTITSGVNNHKA